MFKFLDLQSLGIPQKKFEAIQKWIADVVKWQQVQNLTDAATVSWNYGNGYNTTVTLAGNRTLAITNIPNGSYGTIKIVQDSTGGRTLTLPSGSKVVNGGAGTLTLTTAANSTDVASFYYDGVNYFWTISLNFT